jgi:hypothetical protein
MRYVAIQVIETAYGRHECGGAAAVARARLPLALPLPAIAGPGVVHLCRRSWRTDFDVRGTCAPVRFGDDSGAVIEQRFAVHAHDERLVVQIYDAARPWRDTLLLDVPHGACGRLRWNLRVRENYAHWYQDFVMNVGLFAAPPDATIFLAAPAVTRDLRVNLLRNGYRRQQPQRAR